MWWDGLCYFVFLRIRIILCVWSSHATIWATVTTNPLPPPTCSTVTSHPDLTCPRWQTTLRALSHIFCRFFSFRRGGCCCRRADKKKRFDYKQNQRVLFWGGGSEACWWVAEEREWVSERVRACVSSAQCTWWRKKCKRKSFKETTSYFLLFFFFLIIIAIEKEKKRAIRAHFPLPLHVWVQLNIRHEKMIKVHAIVEKSSLQSRNDRSARKRAKDEC